MSGRQRLRPWLIHKINSGEINGLEWIDRKEQIFRIPWKHGGQQDWSPEHSQVFKEWARHTGKYREGLDPPEWAKWKTRLRCAFNKAPDIEELRAQSDTQATNPYKVYKFKNIEKSARSKAKPNQRSAPVSQQNITVPTEQTIPLFVDQEQVSLSKSGDLPSDLVGIQSCELVQGATAAEITENVSMGSLPSFSDVTAERHMSVEADQQAGQVPEVSTTMLEAMATVNLPVSLHSSSVASPSSCSDITCDQASSPAPSDLSATSVHQQLQHPYQLQSSPLQGDLPCVFPPPVTPVDVICGAQDSVELDRLMNVKILQDLPSHEEVVEGPITLRLLSDNRVTINQELNLPRVLQGYEMSVRVQYLNEKVLEELVNKEDGCRLYYGSDSNIRSMTTAEQAKKILGPEEALQLHLPPCEGFLGPEQEERTQMLLDNITRGLHLECIEGNIYATRFCKTVVYTCCEHQREGVKLTRHVKTKIFDFNMFHTAYQMHQAGHRGAPPSAEVRLSFGQPSNYYSVTECTYISTYVISCRAFRMLQEIDKTVLPFMFDEDMQISDADETDDQLENLRLL